MFAQLFSRRGKQSSLIGLSRVHTIAMFSFCWLLMAAGTTTSPQFAKITQWEKLGVLVLSTSVIPMVISLIGIQWGLRSGWQWVSQGAEKFALLLTRKSWALTIPLVAELLISAGLSQVTWPALQIVFVVEGILYLLMGTGAIAITTQAIAVFSPTGDKEDNSIGIALVNGIMTVLLAAKILMLFHLILP